MIAQQPPLQWIRPPRQARTQQSLERLLDAAEVLLRDKSFDDIHVSEIALRADTSVAAFYRRFHDKNALLYALHQRFSDAAIATADDVLQDERWASAGIREILEKIVPFLIEVLRSQESLQRLSTDLRCPTKPRATAHCAFAAMSSVACANYCLRAAAKSSTPIPNTRFHFPSFKPAP